MQTPLYRQRFDATALLPEHPPRFGHPHKAALFDLAYPTRTASPGTVVVTRWPQYVPASFDLHAAAVDVRPDFFDYVPVDEPKAAVEWHVNFADPRLFCAYGSRLFAQDEMQVAEHPLLASVREALLALGLSTATSDHSGATPILVKNVERRLAVATAPDGAAGRPHGLYGNRFADAPWDVVRRATRRVDPPTTTHLIAMAAPSGGHGDYSAGEITNVLATAHTAFAAAVAESDGRPVVVHTGFWGCGAFGGNRRLMVAMQALATRSAKVDRLVLHTGDAAGVAEARRGLETADRLAAQGGSPCRLSDLVERTEMLACRWGISDGN